MIHVGIDLGTTYSCLAYIDEEGMPNIITNSDNQNTTPSVIWFDGKKAFVGKKANDRKITPTSPIIEFVKRDMGRSDKINSRYKVGDYNYRAVGMSSIILRKIKKEAFNFFKKKGLIPPDAEEKSFTIPAVITVPAYFGDLQRHETRIAGYAAGLDV
ncbi:MAG: Hsp70 family protein, partial [Bacteroidales bacterium]|nr:Hsp70 family protein [Bacteroidales bacterium]